MAVECPLVMVPGLVAAADLRPAQYKIVTLNSSCTVELCDNVADVPLGVLQNKPNTGEECEVMAAGITKIQGDADLAKGNLIGTSADAQAAVVTAAVEALLAVFQDLVVNAVAADELDHALATYRYDLDYSRDHLEELALRYAWGELTGSRRTIAGDLAELASVTPAGLQQTAQTFFSPAHLYGAVLGPYRPRSRRAVEALLAGWAP